MSEPTTPAGGITRLSVSNLLRIRAAEVIPQAGELVIVGGKNDQGKTSLLNAIAIALSGKALPVMPIRAGAASAHVILETADIVVTRKFSQTGGSTLEVRDADGKAISSPQAKLDTLLSRTTFDPLEFTRADPDRQLEIVRNIAGIDFGALNQEYAQKYEQRTAVNRQVREQDSRLNQIQRTPGAPKDLVSVAALMQQLEAAQQVNQANATAREGLSDQNDAVDEAESQVAIAISAIKEAERVLAEKRAEHEQRVQTLMEAQRARDAARESITGLEDVDVTTIQTAIRESEATNEGVRNNQKWNDAHRELVRVQQESQALTARLEEIEREKADRLQKAKFPVEGLGFSDTGVTYNNVPFEQAGSAVKIRVSVGIARSLNPKLPVMLVKDGSLLDVDSLELLRNEAAAHGCQVWMEVVGTREDATVIIEDGEVIATPAADAAKKKKK